MARSPRATAAEVIPPSRGESLLCAGDCLCIVVNANNPPPEFERGNDRRPATKERADNQVTRLRKGFDQAGDTSVALLPLVPLASHIGGVRAVDIASNHSAVYLTFDEIQNRLPVRDAWTGT